MSLSTVCVFCGSRPGARPEFLASAKALGEELARREQPGGGWTRAILVDAKNVSAVKTQAEPIAAEGSVEQIQVGRQLFLEGCSSCHGLEGQGIEAYVDELRERSPFKTG